ncbi:MAG: hypothetical protein NC177_15885 [Ruminococcus flavefaciens]|nr:hypothetical protein [Ruminococcus flavefaciens]
MASEAVKKVLSAEAVSNEKISEARRTAEDIITEAEKYSAIAVQKKISQAVAETEKIRTEYMEKFDVHARQCESDCFEKMAEIRSQAEKNMENAVNAVISEFF